MRTMEFVSFSSTWLMHARREIKNHHKHDNDTNKIQVPPSKQWIHLVPIDGLITILEK